MADNDKHVTPSHSSISNGKRAKQESAPIHVTLQIDAKTLERPFEHLVDYFLDQITNLDLEAVKPGPLREGSTLAAMFRIYKNRNR